MKNSGLQLLGRLAPKKSTAIASSRLGVGFETLDRDMWNVGHAWPVLEDLGVKWARVQSGWAKTEREPGVYDFTWLDEIVDNLLARGVQPWLSVSYGNRLYTPQASADGVGYVPVYTDTERWGWQDYVRALTRHYRDRVGYYEVWNEPDVGFFKPKPDAARYAELVKHTAAWIRSEQPGARIIGGAFASAMTPAGLEFMEVCLRHGLADAVDVISYHGYKYMPEQYVEQEFPAFRHVLRKYKPALRHWQGETGCPSFIPPGNTQALHEMQTSEAVQARWLLRRILTELHHDAAVVSYFNMGDFTKYLLDGDLGYTCHYGLIRSADGTPKPAYAALQSLAALLHDPLEPADGRFSVRLQSADEKRTSREQAAAACQVGLIRGAVPVYAWWLRERVEADPQWGRVTLYYWLDPSLSLRHPVLIDPASQEVYALSLKRNYGMAEFANLPIANTPLLITDRSIVDIDSSSMETKQ